MLLAPRSTSTSLVQPRTVDNLLMMRDPGLEFLSRGPPADLAARLRAFSSRTEMCGKEADKLAGELSLARFLHLLSAGLILRNAATTWRRQRCMFSVHLKNAALFCLLPPLSSSSYSPLHLLHACCCCRDGLSPPPIPSFFCPSFPPPFFFEPGASILVLSIVVLWVVQRMRIPCSSHSKPPRLHCRCSCQCWPTPLAT